MKSLAGAEEAWRREIVQGSEQGGFSGLGQVRRRAGRMGYTESNEGGTYTGR